MRQTWDVSGLHDLIERIARVAEMPPHLAMLALAELLDGANPRSAGAELSSARRTVARMAAEQAGGQASLARQLGLSEMAVSRAINPRKRAH